MRTQSEAIRRDDAWLIRRRHVINVGIVILAAAIVIPIVLRIVDAELNRVRTLEYITGLCIRGAVEKVENVSCSSWAQQFIDNHPSVIKECAECVDDAECYFWCLERGINTLP